MTEKLTVYHSLNRESCGCVADTDGHKYIELCPAHSNEVRMTDPFNAASITAINSVEGILKIFDEDEDLKQFDCATVRKDVLRHLLQLARIGWEEILKDGKY